MPRTHRERERVLATRHFGLISPTVVCASAPEGKPHVKEGNWSLQRLLTVVCWWKLADILYTIACAWIYVFLSSPASNCRMLWRDSSVLITILLIYSLSYFIIIIIFVCCQLCQGGGELMCVRDQFNYRLETSVGVSLHLLVTAVNTQGMASLAWLCMERWHRRCIVLMCTCRLLRWSRVKSDW